MNIHTLLRNTRPVVLPAATLAAMSLFSCNKPPADPHLNFSIVWAKTFGGSNMDRPSDLACDNAGNVFFLTEAWSQDGDLSGYGTNPSWMVKLNADGQKQWQKGISDLDFGGLGKMALCSDGGYVVGGTYTGLQHCRVLKLDSAFNAQWETNVNMSSNAVSGLLESPSGYVCNSIMYSPYGNVSFVDMLDKNGAVVYETGMETEDYAFISLPEGGYFAAGGFNTVWHSSGWEGPRDADVKLFDGSGKIAWSDTLKGAADDELGAALVTSQGNILAGGTSASKDGVVSENHGGNDAWLVMMDKAGRVLWSKTYGGSGNEKVNGVVEMANGNFLVAATSNSSDGDVRGNHGNNDIWLFEVDRNGNFLGGQAVGGSGDDLALHLVKDNNGAYVLIASTTSNDGQVTGNHGSIDAWIVKFKAG